MVTYSTEEPDPFSEWHVLCMARAIEGPRTIDPWGPESHVPLYLQQQYRWYKLGRRQQSRRIQQARSALEAFFDSVIRCTVNSSSLIVATQGKEGTGRNIPNFLLNSNIWDIAAPVDHHSASHWIEFDHENQTVETWCNAAPGRRRFPTRVRCRPMSRMEIIHSLLRDYSREEVLKAYGVVEQPYSPPPPKRKWWQLRK